MPTRAQIAKKFRLKEARDGITMPGISEWERFSFFFYPVFVFFFLLLFFSARAREESIRASIPFLPFFLSLSLPPSPPAPSPSSLDDPAEVFN
jgi:hypothetical protein